jgi:hypothetical protein
MAKEQKVENGDLVKDQVTKRRDRYHQLAAQFAAHAERFREIKARLDQIPVEQICRDFSAAWRLDWKPSTRITASSLYGTKR